MRDAHALSREPAIACWRELYRCDDLKLARAVATSIAAMEFDVRLSSVNPRAWQTAEDEVGDDAETPGPHVIEVPADCWWQLASTLEEIVAEQREFDDMLALRDHRARTRLIIVLSATSAAHALIIWRLLES